MVTTFLAQTYDTTDTRPLHSSRAWSHQLTRHTLGYPRTAILCSRACKIPHLQDLTSYLQIEANFRKKEPLLTPVRIVSCSKPSYQGMRIRALLRVDGLSFAGSCCSQ